MFLAGTPHPGIVWPVARRGQYQEPKIPHGVLEENIDCQHRVAPISLECVWTQYLY